MFTNILNKPKTLNKTSSNRYAYAQIVFFGPLFSLVKHRHVLEIKLHFSGKNFITIPASLLVRGFKKRLVIYGNYQVLMNFISKFINLRKSNIYTGTGLRLRSFSFNALPIIGYRKKPGKITRR